MYIHSRGAIKIFFFTFFFSVDHSAGRKGQPLRNRFIIIFRYFTSIIHFLNGARKFNDIVDVKRVICVQFLEANNCDNSNTSIGIIKITCPRRFIKEY